MSLVIHTSDGNFTIHTPLPTVEQAAEAGSKICRYNGRTRQCFWSIVAHSFCVSDLLETDIERFFGLIHDICSESTIGDIIAPLKVSVLKEVENQVAARTLRKWKIPLPDPDIAAKVHLADVECYIGERSIQPVGHVSRYGKKRSRRAERLTAKYKRLFSGPRREEKEARAFLKRYFELRKLAFGF